jgi:hypothetical protein
METNNKIAVVIAAFSFIFFITVPLNLYSAIGLAFFVFFTIKFFVEIGETLEIRDLIIFIALLEWIVGPALKYHLSPKDIFYYMVIPEAEYMNFVVPASLVFIGGLYFPGIYKKIDYTVQIIRINPILKKHPNIDFILIITGVFSNAVLDFFPQSIRYFLYLIGLSRYIGLFFLILNDRKYKWPIFSGVIFWLFLETVRDAVFHELILWLIFLFMVIAFLYQFNTKKKLMFLIPFIALIILIQSIKFYFRQEIAIYAGTMDRASLFTEMVTKEIQSGEKTMSASNFDAAIDRINQGWIVARIMRYTPDYEPYAKGETIIQGIEASLVPRFLNPDKPQAGGRDNFERFTGKKLSENTSMGLSPLGEAYANFGIDGGILFMFILGLFYNFYMLVIVKLSNRYPSLILWLPLLFLQVVKAETDFVVVLNHLVKASVVVAILIYGIRKVFSIKI